MHNAYNTDLAAHTTHRTAPAPDPHQSTLRRMCLFYSAGLPPQGLVELQYRDRICIVTRIVRQPIMPASTVRLSVWFSVGDCNRHRDHARVSFASGDLGGPARVHAYLDCERARLQPVYLRFGCAQVRAGNGRNLRRHNCECRGRPGAGG